ncbi:hypothetical protein GC176_06105 [bacterium]|nr:hypothetical protein [bacterium]
MLKGNNLKNVALILPKRGARTPALDNRKSVIDWGKLHIDCWHFSSGDVDADIRPQKLVVDHPQAASWDYYPNAGTWGVVSERLWACLKRFSSGYFDGWPATLNGTQFYILRRIGKIDCLDHARCGQHQMGKGISYDPYEFNETELPDSAVFSIPESSFLFATEDVANLVIQKHFNGVRVRNARGHRAMLRNMDWPPSLES